MGSNKGVQTECSEKDVWLFSTGNIANCLIYNMVALYIMFYYTNILGVSAAVAGTIFMVARLVDAFTDPLMGMIVDRTNTKKMGKYRPFITYGAPFLGIAFVLMFTTPSISTSGKIVYAYISYIFYSLTWTCVQIPQLALPIMLSNNIARRTKIQAVFQFCGAIAGLIIQSYALPMIEAMGGQDNPAAWTKVITIYAVAATVLFILSARSVKNLDTYEYHKNSAKAAGGHKLSFKESMQAIFKNRALLCVLLAYGTDMFASQITNSLRIYFYRYNLGGRTDLMVWFGWVGTIASVLMLFFIGSYVKKLGKRVGIALVEGLCLIFTVVVLVAAPQQNAVLCTAAFLANLFLFNFTNTLSRSAVLDSANYAELKTGVACNAVISSTFTFVNKCCQAFSAAFAGHILAWTGYNKDLAQQAPGTLKAILYLMTIVPIIAYICSLIGMYFYPISKKDEATMEQELAAKRSQAMSVAETVVLESED